jgi:hypothetical protein
LSKITFQYNCLWGNADGDFLDCDPELGAIIYNKKKKTDSADIYHNIAKNPIFAGSEYDSLAVEKDLSLPTEKSRMTDTALGKIIHDTLEDSLAFKKRTGQHDRYALSSYSPCIHAGNPAKEFNNSNGSRNDIGIYGGPGGMGPSTPEKHTAAKQKKR